MKLRQYLDETEIPIAAFARRVGVTGATIHNVLKRGNTLLSVAVGIEIATKGEVTCRELLDTNLLKDRKKMDPQKDSKSESKKNKENKNDKAQL